MEVNEQTVITATDNAPVIDSTVTARDTPDMATITSALTHTALLVVATMSPMHTALSVVVTMSPMHTALPTLEVTRISTSRVALPVVTYDQMTTITMTTITVAKCRPYDPDNPIRNQPVSVSLPGLILAINFYIISITVARLVHFLQLHPFIHNDFLNFYLVPCCFLYHCYART